MKTKGKYKTTTTHRVGPRHPTVVVTYASEPQLISSRPITVDFTLEYELGDDVIALQELRAAYKDLEAQILLTSSIG